MIFYKGWQPKFKNHTIKEHIGDISEYLRKHKLETLKELERNEKGRNPSVEEPVSENKLRYEQRKEMDRQIRKLKNKIATVEDDIEFLEQALEGVNTKLSHPEDYREEIKSGSLYKEHGLLEEKLEEVMKQWEILHDHLERLKQ